jgi:hypothetical protein
MFKFYIAKWRVSTEYRFRTGMFRDRHFHPFDFLVTELLLWQIVKKHGAQARMVYDHN